jgi:hypothetical protein
LEKIDLKLYVILIGTGILVGVYLELFIQKQFESLTISAIILAIFGGIGTVRTLVSSLINWHRTPTLKLEKDIHIENKHYQGFTHKVYFLKVVKQRGSTTKANDCEAWLDIKDKHYPTVWAPNNIQLCPIGDYMYMRLFEVKPKQQIIFPQGYPNQGFKEIHEPYEEYINSKLTVSVHSSNAGSKSRTFNSLREIIKES